MAGSGEPGNIRPVMGIWQRSRSSISSGVCRDALAAGVWFLVIQVKGYIQLDGLKSEPHNRAASASNDLVLCPPRDAHCRLVSAAALPCDFSKSVEKSAAEIWTASGGVYSICSFIVVCRFLFKCRRWHPLLAPTEASARRESQGLALNVIGRNPTIHNRVGSREADRP